MNQSIVKFLEFKGKTLLFLTREGTYWIAIKPVCEILNIEYTRTFKNLQDDPVLGPALAKQPMQIPGDQPRNMVCLPEYLIYGWIFSIKSASRELLEYKMECYRVLFNHFHGTITRREELIKDRARIIGERTSLESKLRSLNEDFVRLENVKAEEARIAKSLKSLEKEEIDEQLKLFES
jgi:hypothetical protein